MFLKCFVVYNLLVECSYVYERYNIVCSGDAHVTGATMRVHVHD